MKDHNASTTVRVFDQTIKLTVIMPRHNRREGTRCRDAYASGIWTDRGDLPEGVLYLEFDWARQIDALLSEHCLFIDGGRGRTTISVIDRRNRLVSTSGTGRFGDDHPLRHPQPRGRISDARKVTAFATASEYQGFDGLGLRCVIDQDHFAPPSTG